MFFSFKFRFAYFVVDIYKYFSFPTLIKNILNVKFWIVVENGAFDQVIGENAIEYLISFSYINAISVIYSSADWIGHPYNEYENVSFCWTVFVVVVVVLIYYKPCQTFVINPFGGWPSGLSVG